MEEEASKDGEFRKSYSFASSEDDYFMAVNEKRRNTENVIDRSKGFIRFKNEHTVQFSWYYFIEYYFYHTIYYFILGPFIVLLFPLFGTNLLRNLGFIGFTRSNMIQGLVWLTIVSVIVVLIVEPEWNLDNNVVNITDLYTVTTLTLIRIANIASKYATYTPEKISYMKKNEFTLQEMSSEMLFGDWSKQGEDKILEELESAMKRSEIDFNIVILRFLRALNPDTAKSVSAKQASFRSRNESLFSIYLPNCKKKQPLEDSDDNADQRLNYVFGVALLHDLLERYRAISSNKGMVIASIIIAIIRIMIPWFTYRDFSYLTSWVSWVVVVLLSLQNVFLYTQNSVFFSLTEVDIKRKIFIERQLSYMIMPRKTRTANIAPKLYPTTDFLCPKNLRAWNLLRKISRDYGYKYSLRQSNNLGWASFIYVTLGVFLALDFFGVLSLKLTTTNPDKALAASTLEILIGFDVAFYFMLVVKELLYGINLNFFYQLHQNNLEELQIFVSDITRQMDWYFVKGIKPKNYLYTFAVKHLRHGHNSEEHLQETSHTLKEVLTTIKELICDLEYEIAQRPYTVLGFVPSYQTLRLLGVGVFSVMYAVVQYHIKKNHQQN